MTEGASTTHRVALYVEVDVPVDDADAARQIAVLGLRRAGFVPIQGTMADAVGTSVLPVAYANEFGRAHHDGRLPVVDRQEPGLAAGIQQFSARGRNTLSRMGCHTVDDVARTSPLRMLDEPGFGVRTLVEVRQVLGRYDYKLDWFAVIDSEPRPNDIQVLRMVLGRVLNPPVEGSSDA